jgi:hypothetical protein
MMESKFCGKGGASLEGIGAAHGAREGHRFCFLIRQSANGGGFGLSGPEISNGRSWLWRTQRICDGNLTEVESVR